MLRPDLELSPITGLDVPTSIGCFEVLLQCGKRWHRLKELLFKLFTFGSAPIRNLTYTNVAAAIHCCIVVFDWVRYSQPVLL